MGIRPTAKTMLNGELITTKDVGRTFHNPTNRGIEIWTITAKSHVYRNDWKGHPRRSYDMRTAKWERLSLDRFGEET